MTIERLEEKVACEVNIYCLQPDAEGNMNVGMSYQGDPCLIAYLLEGALQQIQESIPASTLRSACE